MSGQSPIYLKLKIDSLERFTSDDKATTYHERQNWKKAIPNDIKNYKLSLKNKLNSILIPESVVHCKDLHCNNIDHKLNIDDYIIDIIEAIEDSTK